MSWPRIVVYCMLSVLCMSPGSVTMVTGQGQVTEVKVLEGVDDGQCPSMEEREGAINEIHQIAYSEILATICNGTPGWRRVAFINMTDTSYNCPTGLNLTYSQRTCRRSHKIFDRWQFPTVIGGGTGSDVLNTDSLNSFVGSLNTVAVFLRIMLWYFREL